MAKYNYFLVENKLGVTHVKINRPKKANALNQQCWEEMQVIFETLSNDEATRVIVLSGEGKHFTAGIDLELLMSIQGLQSVSCEGRKREQLLALIKKLQAPIKAIDHCRKPVIAAIHNACVGAGVDIISACDMSYCTEDAYFSIKEIDMGMVADLGTLQRLPKLISPAFAAEMAFTGRKVHGPEAASKGIVNHCYKNKEDMMKKVGETAQLIASKSPLSIRGTKEILQHTRDHSVEDGLNYMAIWNASIILSNDLIEAFQASIEKRKGEFEN